MDSYLCKQWHLRSHNGERPPSRLALGRRFEIDPRLVRHMHKMLTDNPNPVVRGIVNRYVGEFGAVPGHRGAACPTTTGVRWPRTSSAGRPSDT
jgi:hypothetical protein